MEQGVAEVIVLRRREEEQAGQSGGEVTVVRFVRLLGLANYLPPLNYGYAEICADAMGALAARGHDVTVLCADGGQDETRFRVRRALHHVPAAWRRPVAGLRGEAASQAAVRAALAEGVDAAVAWHMRGVGKGTLTLLHRAGVPVVYMLGDLWVIYERPGPPSWWRAWTSLDRRAAYRTLRDAAGAAAGAGRIELRQPPIAEQGEVCFASAWLRERYRSLGWEARHTHVVANGIDVARFAAAPRERTAGEPLDVLFAGRIDPDKGADLAIQAAAAVSDVRLTVVGTGLSGTRERLEASAGAHVRFLGQQTRDEVAALMRSCHVFVMPGRVEESFGLVYLEAMAAGAAVVGTARGGAAELCHDGKDALVVEPDVEQLAGALRRLAADEPLRARLAGAGAATAARYSLDAMADRLQSILDQVVSARS
jgi:glycosyltransferase involved in cell wall biosynthesis